MLFLGPPPKKTKNKTTTTKQTNNTENIPYSTIIKCICFQTSRKLLIPQSLMLGIIGPGVCLIIIKLRASLPYFHCPPTLKLCEHLQRSSSTHAIFSSVLRLEITLHFSSIIHLCNCNWSSDELLNLEMRISLAYSNENIWACFYKKLLLLLIL